MTERTITMVAAICILTGGSLAVSSVFILFGVGWALLAGAVPLMGIGMVLFRGLKHGSE